MEYLEKNLEKLRKYRKYFYEKLIDIMQKGDLKYDRFKDRKSTRLNSSHNNQSRMPSSA